MQPIFTYLIPQLIDFTLLSFKLVHIQWELDKMFLRERYKANKPKSETKYIERVSSSDDNSLALNVRNE